MVDYIVIQAGGKGTRLKQLTKNKPKGIVSIDNLPIIFHLFRQFPKSNFIVIGDYLKDVLDRYLDAFADVKYYTVEAESNGGTCSGIKRAMDLIPDNKQFMLIWSDLILDKHLELPDGGKTNYIGISESFECRWSYVDGRFIEEPSVRDGVAGLFIFTNKKMLDNVPNVGEFVFWLKNENLTFEKFGLKDTKECGSLANLPVKSLGKCRPFNKLYVEDGVLTKIGIDKQGRELGEREKRWYLHVKDYNISIPEIYGYDPLQMEYIGKINILSDLSYEDKKDILAKIMKSIEQLHQYDLAATNYFSMYEAYYRKTLRRLSKIQNLVPFANEEYIVINGKKCHNVFFVLDLLRERVKAIKCPGFSLIHGDCTFANIIVRQDHQPVFIDPRGYFGYDEIIGDPNYDWAKLYYSVCGEYDQFNNGNYRLEITEKGVVLNIETNGWKSLESEFESNLPSNIRMSDIRLIHAIIWLSLTTYAWDDYDSICGAFYNGLLYLEGCL